MLLTSIFIEFVTQFISFVTFQRKKKKWMDPYGDEK